jgi:hypothetical protein
MMKMQSWMAAASIVAAATAAAQTPPRASTAAAAERVMVVGCVERADQILSRESSLGTTVDSLSFVLVKAEEGKASDQQKPAAPAGGEQPIGKIYRLAADVDMINPHVGHRVEITATRAQDAPVGTAGRADAAASNPVVPPPVLKVESIKMLASTCNR